MLSRVLDVRDKKWAKRGRNTAERGCFDIPKMCLEHKPVYLDQVKSGESFMEFSFVRQMSVECRHSISLHQSISSQCTFPQ